MKAAKTLLIVTAMMSVCHAKTLDIGGRSLEVPAPEGFVEVTAEMPVLYGAARKLVDPDNETLGIYIPANMAEAAKSGEAVPAIKYFVLKVQGNTKFVTMGDADFAGMVAAVKSSSQMVADELKSELGDAYDPATVVKLKGVAVLPQHHEAKTSFANSMLINQAALGGKDENQVMSATKSYANVGGKVLLLLGYGAEKDLDWTRTATGAWTEAVLSSNPAPPAGSMQSGTAEQGGSNDGLKSGLIGAVLGALVAMVLFALKGRRKG